MIPWLAVSAGALAQEAPAPEAPAPPASYEITVWGDLAVQKARDEIVRQIEAHGYVVARRKDGDTVFHGRPRWLGHLRLTEDGDLLFSRTMIGLSPLPPELYDNDPRYEDLTRTNPIGIEPICNQPPDDGNLFGPGTPEACVGAGPVKVTFWMAPSKTKLRTAWDRVLVDTRDEVDAFVAVKRRTVFEQSILDLPDRLDALWISGTPLEPGPVLQLPEERRRAILEFWATRTDTPEGRRTSEAVGDWLSAVVEESPTPITAEERAEFSARRPDLALP